METISNKGNLDHQFYLYQCFSFVFNSSFGNKLNVGVTLSFQVPEHKWMTNFTFSYSFEKVNIMCFQNM